MSVQHSTCAPDLYTGTAGDVTQAGLQASKSPEVGQEDPGAAPSNPAVTDPAKTPRGEEPPMLSRRTDIRSIVNETTPTARSDYFARDLPPSISRTETESTNSNVSSPLQSAGASSSSLHSTGLASVTATAGSGHSGESKHASELRSKLFKVQSYNSVTPSTASGSTSNQSAGPSRPTTNYNRAPPQYPDQSFAALSRQRFTPPYPYRSNSPFASQGSHASASPNNLSSEHLHLPGVSRTEGNTPVESPGLFQPGGALRRGRDADEMEPNQYKMPALHPTHGMMPKESHSLRKDVDHLTGHKLINNYEVLKELGTGTHGKVKLARVSGSPNGAKVAIKIVKRFRRKRLTLSGPQTQEDRVKKEIAVLKKARHHHVVSLLEVIDDPEADKVYMVLEYVEEGEMKWRRKADKWTVDFERHRIERERDAWNNNETIDADLFAQEVADFNSQRETRAAEKRRDLAKHKKLAYQMVSSPSRRSSVATILTDDESSARVLAAKWSLEHGGDSDDETSTGQEHGQEQGSETISRPLSSLSLAQWSGDPEHGSSRIDFQPMGGLEVSTVFKDPFVPESAPMSPLLGQGVSHPSGSQLSDTMENDTAFLAALKKIQRDEDARLFDREDKPYRHVPCLSMTRCRECFRDTVLGLEYLHYQGIIHRDIKPANLLWDRGRRVKISDFGVSYLGHSPRGVTDDEDREPGVHDDDEVELAKTVGTPAFYAPELCDPELFADGRDNRRHIGSAMDVWALGVTLYCMIFARLPFDDLDNNEMSLYHKIANEEVFIPRMRPRAVRLRKTDGYEPKDRDEDALEYEAIGDELHDLLKRLLHKNPAQRITIQEIKRHPWVVHGMENLMEWLDKTDPANYISDKKIRVTNEDVSAAMQPMNLLASIKQGVKRFTSLVRGRESSRGAGSRSGDKTLRASSQVSSGLSAGTGNRRASLRDPEQIANLIRAQRTDEHPLSQSQVPSPQEDGYFTGRPVPGTHETTPLARPNPLPRGGSTTESVMTVRATRSRGDMRWHFPGASSLDDSLPLVAPSTLPYAGATNIYGKQFSQPPSHGLASQRSSLSSYSATSGTSSDNLSGSFDDAATHASPSIAMSSATATGRVAPPSVLQETSSASSSSHDRPRGQHATSYSAHQRHRSQPQATGRQRAVSALTPPRSGAGHVRQDRENATRHAEEPNSRRHDQDWMMRGGAARGSRPTSRDLTNERPPAPSIEAEDYNQKLESTVTARPRSLTSTGQHRGSRADVSGASSSDDFYAGATFSDNSRHPSMPSVISSVGSSSVDAHDTFKQYAAHHGGKNKVNDSLMSTGETVTPTRTGFRGFLDTAETGQEKQWQNYTFRKPAPRHELTTSGVDDDEAGYIGDQDNNADMDSDDEGIVFGGKHV